jgi:hypothetical protein
VAISDVYVARSGSVAVAATTATAVLSLYGTAAASNTGTSLASGNPHDYSASASIGQMATAWSTAPTVGTVLWEQELPQTTGSSWEEFPPTGYEWGVPAIANANANAGVHVFVTPTVGTSTPVFIDLIWSE